MTNNVIDKVCGSKETKEFAFKKQRKYFRCIKCGTIFLHPEPSLEELKKYYSDMPENYQVGMRQTKSNEIKFRYLFDHYLTKYISITKNAKLVDVGCFIGDFLQVCKEKGLEEIYGFEVNESAIKVLKEKKIKVIDQIFSDSTFFKREEVDIVCMLDLIEHVKEPREYLNKAFKILKKVDILF